MIISINTEKAPNKNSMPLRDKNTHQAGNRRKLPAPAQGIHENPQRACEPVEDQQLLAQDQEQDEDTHSHHFCSTLSRVPAGPLGKKMG